MISLGEELKREREFREISLREISDATKINMRILEAIERDHYDILPGGIFNRNFIRAYAEFIGLDPEIAVRKYQVQTSQPEDQKLPPNLIGQDKNLSGSSFNVRWIIGGLILAVLALLSWYLWVHAPKDLFKRSDVNRIQRTPATHSCPILAMV
jgi:cytoskeletal protein RodZ